MSKRVFILGAGCSASYGYPLGRALGSELKQLLATIPEECRIIRNAVQDSLGVAATFPQADTLDTLVNLTEERYRAFREGRGTEWLDADAEQETLTDKQILDVKIATSALEKGSVPEFRN
jgi:hypothetical protein